MVVSLRGTTSGFRSGKEDLLPWQEEFNKVVNQVRASVERVIAHFKWRIMHTDYRHHRQHPLRPFRPSLPSTITRYGRAYIGPEFDVGNQGVSASVRAGWILQKATPTATQTDGFVHGWGATGSGILPVIGDVAGPSAGVTNGDIGGRHLNDFAAELGAGVSAGHSYGAGAGYNWHFGNWPPDW